ncbi:hypothetical protein Bbelb_255650 [Branchiostoma belcheri]|nr:hypothetical protein Bbelb_255650 [Branchiostoma belcheri]
MYRAQMLRRVINAVDNDEVNSAQKFAKTTTIFATLFMARESWKGVEEVNVQIVAAPEGTQEEFEDSVDIHAGENCTGARLTRNGVRKRRRRRATPSPSSTSVDRTLYLLRRWMQFHDHKDYNKYVKLEGSIHIFRLSKRKQKTITDLS